MKPRADTTFREFKAGCKRNATNGSEVCRKCEQKPLCDEIVVMEKAPAYWNLTDPPRFNEQQMALLKALYGIGVNKIQSGAAFDGIYLYTKDLIDTAGLIYSGKIGTSIKLEDGETLDLAELLRKEKNE